MRFDRCWIIGGIAWLTLTAPALADVFYIPLGNDNAILMIDPDRDVAVGRIEGVPAVHGLAATLDGRFLIAGSYSERSVGEAPPPKPTAVTEEEHAEHHAKPIEGARKPVSVVSSVSIIDAASNEVVRRIDVPGAVHHVAVSPNGRLAAVTHPNQDAVSVIDLQGYQVVATVATGPLPNYSVFAPDSRRLYVSNAGNKTVSDVDTARWIVSRNFIVGESPEHLVLSSDGSRLYVNNVEGGTVAVVATGSGKVVKTYVVGAPLHGIDLSDDGKTLFVAALGDDKLVAIDLDTGKTGETNLAPQPYHLAVVRGRGKIYVSSAEAPKAWVVDQATRKIVKEIQLGGKGHQMVLAPSS